MVTSSVPPRRRKPAPKPGVRRPVRASETAQIKEVIPQGPKPQTLDQHAQALILKDKEIAILKRNLNNYQKKLSTIKQVAVSMASLASRNNSIVARQVFDWGNTIMKTINDK